MTPAETLRAAAARIQEVAQAATPGPWRSFTAGHSVIVEQANIRDDDHLIAELARCEDHPDVATPDGTYIAMWHPGLALAVADWLEAEADFAERLGEFTEHAISVGWEIRTSASTLGQSLVVARDLLSTDET